MLRELFLKTDKMLFFSVLVKKKVSFSPKTGARQATDAHRTTRIGKRKKKREKKCNKKKIFEIYKKIYDHQSTIAEAPEAVV